MDRQSYEDGRTGRGSGPNTDIDAYRSGQRAAEAGQYKPGWEGGESKASEPIPLGPKVQVDGTAFTLLITAPFLFTIYPVWGLTLYAAGGAVFWVLAQVTPNSGFAVLAGVIAAVAGFFLGMRLEVVASQFTIYRLGRMVGRWVAAFLFVIWMGTSNGSLETMSQLVNRASGGVFFGGILVAALAHFVFKRADRMYFPVAKELAKMQELAARGETLKRGFGKRVVYSLLWIIPFLIVFNVVVRLALALVMEPAARVALERSYGNLVPLIGLPFWLVLSIAGLLPGTGRVAMSVEKLQSVT